MCGEQDCPWRTKFGDEAIIELADALHGNKQLTALSIASNQLTDEGAIAIAEALRHNDALSDLNLNDNQVGDTGALALADVLGENDVLTMLSLSYNELTDVGGRVLLGVLKSNASALEVLHLDNNPVSTGLIAEAEEESRLAFVPPETDSPTRDEL